MADCCNGKGCVTKEMADRSDREVGRGLRLEALRITWMAAEAAVDIGAGTAASSLLLAAFGADSLIELLSAVVLFHRLWQEYRARRAEVGT